MKRIAYLTVAVVFACGIGLAIAADTTMSANGKVTAVADDSLTVSAKGKDWKFDVDKDTKVIAKGAGTKTMEKKEAGMAGPKLSEVVHEGDMVAVKYHDMGGGKMHAAEVRVRTQAPIKKGS